MGYTQGFINLLDLKSGYIKGEWKGHDGEVSKVRNLSNLIHSGGILWKNQNSHQISP